jgi:Trk K+ transport system NAD-binding subunit
MKALVTVVSTFLESRTSRQNLLFLFRFLAILVALMAIFSVTFHFLMEREGQDHSWVTGLYWTLTVMSTLGFGDITFESDAGRVFSIIVLMTGVVFLLVLLPFTFIEFFYAPWMKAQSAARAPRQLPPDTRDHIILTGHGPITKILVRMLERHRHPFFILVPTLNEALELHDHELKPVLGDPSDPDTYRRLRVDQAAMVVTTRSDIGNTNVTFAVREVSDNVTVISSARSAAARDALELAGVTHLLQLEEMMGQALSRRVVGGDSSAHVIGTVEQLVIAEASAGGSPLVGKTLAESQVRETCGVTIVGLWDHGKLVPPEPDTKILSTTLFVLAGAADQIDAYNEHFGGPAAEDPEKSRVVIIGGGRVGRATARALDEREIPWTIIEKESDRVEFPKRTIIGDGSEFDLLVKAGLHQAATVIVTTRDDDTNVFLTIFYRRLRKSLQIISRCTEADAVARLHRAGADLVLSYASMSANVIFNHLRGSDNVLLAEGVSIFTFSIPRSLAGKTLAQTQVRSRTGCSILAIESAEEKLINPPPDARIPAEGKIVLMGSLEAEEQFVAIYRCA